MAPVPVRRQVAAFRVTGEPKTKGSAQGFVATKKDGTIVRDRNGRPVVNIVNDNTREKIWRRAVEAQAKEYLPKEPLAGPVEVVVIFLLPRPDNPKFTDYPIGHQQGDLDKLQRSLGDALEVNAALLKRGTAAALRKAGFFLDDKQVVHWDAWKVYSREPGAWIEVNDLSAQMSLF